MPSRKRSQEDKRRLAAQSEPTEAEEAVLLAEPDTNPAATILRNVNDAHSGGIYGHVFELLSVIANLHPSGPNAVQYLEGPVTCRPPWGFVSAPAGSAVVLWEHAVRNWNFFGYRRIMPYAYIAVVPLEKSREALLGLALHEPDGRRFVLQFAGGDLAEIRQINPDAPGGYWVRAIPDTPVGEPLDWIAEVEELIAGSELAQSGKLMQLFHNIRNDLTGYINSTGEQGYFGYNSHSTDTAEVEDEYRRDQRWIGVFKPGWEAYITERYQERLAQCNT